MLESKTANEIMTDLVSKYMTPWFDGAIVSQERDIADLDGEDDARGLLSLPSCCRVYKSSTARELGHDPPLHTAETD